MRSPCSIAPAAALAAAALLIAAPAAAQTTDRASVSSSGQQGSGVSHDPSISAGGLSLAFASFAGNLVPADWNGASDVFVHEFLTGRTVLVSRDSAGLQGNADSGDPSIAADGLRVAFWSAADNLVPGDANAALDVFVHDRTTDQTVLASVDSSGAQGNGPSAGAALSRDGRTVTFVSYADNLVPGDTNGAADVFVRDLLTGQTTRISVDSAGTQGDGASLDPAISADGRIVAFESDAGNLVPGDGNGAVDVFIHDRLTGTTTRVSVDSAGVQADADSGDPSLSADGRQVAFQSLAGNLVPADTNRVGDVFAHDRVTGETTRVSVDSAGAQADDASYEPAISAAGRHVAFSSSAGNLVPGGGSGLEIYVHDRYGGRTARISADSAGVPGNGRSENPSVSADGRYVAFSSDSTNLVAGDTNALPDVFVRDRGGPKLELAGVCPGAVTLTVTGVTAGGSVAIFHGPAGLFTKATQPCAGVTLLLLPPSLGAVLVADAAGAASTSFHAPNFVCGLTVQAVDVANCQPTNAIVL